MAAEKTGGPQISVRAQRYADRCARYQEMLAGHALDAFPANLDELVKALWLPRWYPRPAPEGEAQNYWLYHAPWNSDEDTTEWRQHVFDEENVVARRELVKKAFGPLKIEEQVCLALNYGLLDGVVPEKRVQYIANVLETGLHTVRHTRRRALDRLMRLCEHRAWYVEPAPLDLSDPEQVGIHELDFEFLTYMGLRNSSVATLADLERKTAQQLKGFRGFGKKGLTEVCRKLKLLGRPLPEGTENYLDIESL